MTTEKARRHRIRIHYDEPRHDGPVGGVAILFVLELEPPYEGDIDAFDVRIGRSFAQARMVAHRFFDSDGQTELGFIVNGHFRAIAQLWHSLHIAHGEEIPVSFLRLDNDAKIDQPVIQGL